VPVHSAPATCAPAGRAGDVSRGRQRKRMTERPQVTGPDATRPDPARVDSTVPRRVGIGKAALVDEVTVEQRRVPIVVAASSGKPVIVALRDRLARREQGAAQDDNDDGHGQSLTPPEPRLVGGPGRRSRLGTRNSEAALTAHGDGRPTTSSVSPPPQQRQHAPSPEAAPPPHSPPKSSWTVSPNSTADVRESILVAPPSAWCRAPRLGVRFRRGGREPARAGWPRRSVSWR